MKWQDYFKVVKNATGFFDVIEIYSGTTYQLNMESHVAEHEANNMFEEMLTQVQAEMEVEFVS